MARGIRIPVSLETRGLNAQLNFLERRTSQALEGISRELSQLGRLQSQITNGFTAMGRNRGLDRLGRSAQNTNGFIAGLTAGITSQLIPAMADLGRAMFNAATEVENLEVKFVPLLGSFQKARDRMADLREQAAKTPFQLPELAKGNIILQNLTGGLLAGKKGMELVGDAAAVAGVNFSELSVTVGRAFDAIRNNAPAGEELARLNDLGLITAKARRELLEIRKTGKAGDGLKLLRKELERSKGAMQLLSQTTKGLISTLSDNLKQRLTEIAGPTLALFRQSLRDGIGDVQDFASETAVWGARLGKAFALFQFGIKAVGNFVSFAGTAINKLITAAVTPLGVAIGTVSNIFDKLSRGDFKGAFTEQFKGAALVVKEQNKTFKELGKSAQGFIDDNGTAFQDLKFKLMEMDGLVKQSVQNVKKEREKVKVLTLDEIFAADNGAIESTKAQLAEISRERETLRQSFLEARRLEAETERELIRVNAKIDIEESKLVWDTKIDLAKKFNQDVKQLEEARAADALKIQKEANNKIAELDKKDADRLKAKDRQRVSLLHNQMSQTAGFINSMGTIIAVTNKKNAKLQKGIAIGQATINGAVAVTKAATAAPWPANLPSIAFAAGNTAAQIATINAQEFQRGGLPRGQNALVRMNENGQEAVLNNAATQRIGSQNINALNSGADLRTLTPQQPQQNITMEVYYSPTQNFNGSDSGDIFEALENDRERFAEFVEENIQKGII